MIADLRQLAYDRGGLVTLYVNHLILLLSPASLMKSITSGN